MVPKFENTYRVDIYLAGDLTIIHQECRKYCKEVGLCVTVEPTLFIYTGGEEYGARIGLINYPRFPDTQENIFKKAVELAHKCREATYQHSYLVMDNEKTVYHSTRPENK